MTAASTIVTSIYTTCPPSAMSDPETCADSLRHVSQWSESAGCDGMLIFSDNRQLDPWLVSREVIAATSTLCPLVAVQPAYMHPYAVAKMISSLAFMFGRRVDLNMVAGGFKKDLEALGDGTPHDERYDRLTEYTRIVDGLLRGDEPMSLDGHYYRVSNLKLLPPLPPALRPGLLISGSSAAGRAAAAAIAATPVTYPRPPREYRGADRGEHEGTGIRIGITARESESEAWNTARRRFPEDRKGQITRQVATKVSDSKWHEQLADSAEDAELDGAYWLGPFNNYKAMCPYLVGSYEQVAAELRHYLDAGVRTFILDEPGDAEDLAHAGRAFRLAREALAA